MTTKTCFECHETKPAEDFYPHPSHHDRLSTRCRACTGADMARRWRAKHPEPAPYVPPTEKACKKCGEVKPLDQFHQRTEARDGRQPRCAVCMTEAALSYNKRNPKIHARHARAYHTRHPDRTADSNLRWRLGLPRGTYAKMLAAQDGKCAICGTTETSDARTKRFHVDHDTSTGVVRGLLCGRCNIGIGQLQHDTNILDAAIKYLTKGSGV